MTKEEVIAKLNGIRQVNDLYARGETQEQYDRRMAQSAVAIERAISMLQNATIWTPCTERMPRYEDADVDGYVNVQRKDGTFGTEEYQGVISDHYAWSRITPIERGEG